MKNLKSIMVASFVIATGYTGLVSAHTLTDSSVGLAGSGVARTDTYLVNCYDDGAGAPTKLFIQVRDNAPVKLPSVSIQASKGGVSTALSTDAVDGDAAYSPATTLAKGAGDYTVTVNKSAYTGTLAAHKGAELYTGVAHCQTSTGAHTGTDISLTVNQ